MTVEGPLISAAGGQKYYYVCPECPLQNLPSTKISERPACSSETIKNCQKVFEDNILKNNDGTNASSSPT